MVKKINVILLIVFSFLLVSCTKISYRVDFYVEDRLYETYFVDENALIDEISAPEKAGYEFSHWSYENEPYKFSNPVTNNMRLDAKYNLLENKFKVSFYVDYELYQEVFVDKSIAKIDAIEAPEKVGYEFLYWLFDEVEFDFNNTITDDIRLDGRYQKTEVLRDDFTGTYNLLYINDTHGAVLNKEAEMGLSRIGNLVLDEFNKKPDETIFLAGGDIFQGQLESNASRGAVMIEAFNAMKLDALVLGNHEFDWGIEEILKYFDPNTTGVKADFPLLGANILKKANNEMLDFVKPYTILERNNTKVGIIGVIGEGLESSIMKYRVDDYYFSSPTESVRKYAKELREYHLVDSVIVVHHGSSYYFTQSISNLSGASKADALFNAHTHQIEEGFSGSMPHMQSGSNGVRVGNIKLNYSITNNEANVDRASATLNQLSISNENRLNTPNPKVEKVINEYLAEINDLLNAEIIKAKYPMNKTDLSRFITRAIYEYTNVDIAIHNNGGTRAEISQGSITAADIFKVFPFDNKIVLLNVSGYKLNSFYNGGWLTYHAENTNFNNNETYLVATNDYVYFGNIDKLADEYTLYELDLYELLLKVLKDIKASGIDEFDSNTLFPING